MFAQKIKKNFIVRDVIIDYMDNLNDLQSKEYICAKKTHEIFKNEIFMQNELLVFYATLLKERKVERDHICDVQEISILLLNAEMINSMWCNLSVLINGYYHDSFVITRNIHESMHLCKYFLKNPKEASEWLNGKQISHKKVIKNLKIDQNQQDIYGILCNFTHPNIKGSIADLVLREHNVDTNLDSKIIDIKIGSLFNENIAYLLFLKQSLYAMTSIENFYAFLDNCDWCQINDEMKNKKNEVKKKFISYLEKNQIKVQERINSSRSSMVISADK
jgi:hypothetical protein